MNIYTTLIYCSFKKRVFLETNTASPVMCELHYHMAVKTHRRHVNVTVVQKSTAATEKT